MLKRKTPRYILVCSALFYGMVIHLFQSGILAQSVDDILASGIMVEADKMTSKKGKDQLIAEGNVHVIYGTYSLRADRLVYDENTGTIWAVGNVQVNEGDGVIRYSDEIEISDSFEDGYAINFSSPLGDGSQIASKFAIHRANSDNILEKVVYTACPVCVDNSGKHTTPTWQIRAGKAVQDETNQMIRYRDIVLDVAGLPVLYLPYFAHPDPSSGPRSGFLIPDIGISSKLGIYYRQPYYWRISNSQDIIIAPQLSESVAPHVNLEYRKRFYSGELTIDTSLTKEQEFDSDGNKFGDNSWRSHIFAKGLFAINTQWKWGVGLERTSDDLYLRRYDIDGEREQRGLYQGQGNRLLSQLFVTGQDKGFYADLAFLSVQELAPNRDEALSPTASPVGFAERYYDLGVYGVAAINASTAILNRSEGVDSHRMSLGTDWRWQNYLAGGGVFSTFAEGRGDYYRLGDLPNNVENVSRLVGLVGAEVKWPLYRAGNTLDILIEPKIMMAWGTSELNDMDIPIEDSGFYEYDESRIFQPNASANYDLWESGGRLAAGISASMQWRGGTKLLAILGRRWRSEVDPAFSTLSNLDGKASDYVTSLDVWFNEHLSMQTRFRLDDKDFTIRRADIAASMKWDRLQAQIRYFQRDADLLNNNTAEGIIVNSAVKLRDELSVIYRLRRNIDKEISIHQVIGFAYSDECSYFELVYERNNAQTGNLGPSDSIKFRFLLKGLGGINDQNFD